MTASRDQDLWQYALDLGYEDQGHSGDGPTRFVHGKTGEVVWVQHTAGDYAGLQKTLSELRRGAGVSARGREAVVNDRKPKRPKRGANSARLERERIWRQRQAYEAQAELRHAESQEESQPAPRPVRVPGAVLKRMRQLRDIEGLMRGV